VSLDNLCGEIKRLADEIDQLFYDHETSKLSEDELRKVFEEPLRKYGELVKKLLADLGMSKYSGTIDGVIETLIENSGYITDPDPHDYWWAGWRYLASTIGEICGETPYYGAGDPTEMLSVDDLRSLRRLLCELGK